MKKIRSVLSICLVMCAVFLLSSCFAGVKGKISNSGKQNGFYYLYLKEGQLLILNGEGTLSANDQVLARKFSGSVKNIFLSSGISSVEKNAFASFEELETVYASGAPKGLEQAVAGEIQICTDVSDFETAPHLQNGFLPGHCPVREAGRCLICDDSYTYDFESLFAFMMYKEQPLVHAEIVTEGILRKTDEKGMILTEGLTVLDGEVRYFSENRMITGTKDQDGIRYSFGSDGALSSEKEIDSSIPVSSVLLIASAVPLGVAGCFAVYFIYKKKAK